MTINWKEIASRAFLSSAPEMSLEAEEAAAVRAEPIASVMQAGAEGLELIMSPARVSVRISPDHEAFEEGDPQADLIRAYCHEYADVIAVRDNIGQGWRSYFLTELPLDVALKWIERWVGEGRFPSRLKRPGEV